MTGNRRQETEEKRQKTGETIDKSFIFIDGLVIRPDLLTLECWKTRIEKFILSVRDDSDDRQFVKCI